MTRFLDQWKSPGPLGNTPSGHAYPLVCVYSSLRAVLHPYSGGSPSCGTEPNWALQFLGNKDSFILIISIFFYCIAQAGLEFRFSPG